MQQEKETKAKETAARFVSEVRRKIPLSVNQKPKKNPDLETKNEKPKEQKQPDGVIVTDLEQDPAEVKRLIGNGREDAEQI